MADLQKTLPEPDDAVTEQLGSRNSRRGFLKAVGGTAGAAALILAGCDSAGPGDGPGPGPSPGPGGGSDVDSITLDFSDDFGALNFAYLLEQLESRFYSIACKGPNSPYDGISTIERYYLSALDSHEGAHDALLMAAIPDDQRIPDDLEFDFSSVDFTDRTSVLSTAQALEDTGVSAYNGAARFISSDTFLGLAGKIVSVEARHAATIRLAFLDDPGAFADLESLTSFGADPENALDAAQPPEDVIALAAPFVTFDVNVINT